MAGPVVRRWIAPVVSTVFAVGASVVVPGRAGADGSLDPRLQGTGVLVGDLHAFGRLTQGAFLRKVVRDRYGRWLVHEQFVLHGVPSGDTLARYWLDGTPDPTFGSDGRLLMSGFPLAPVTNSPVTFTLLLDGRIVVYGTQVDIVVGPDGAYEQALPSATGPTSGSIGDTLPDGTQLLTGSSGERRLATVDPLSRTAPAHAYAPDPRPGLYRLEHLLTDASGVTYHHRCGSDGSVSTCNLTAYTPAGDVVTGYGDGGVVALPRGPGIASSTDCQAAVAPDGAVVAACDGTDAATVRLTRFDPRGHAVPGFGPAVVPAGAAVAVEGTGRILTVGADTSGAEPHAVFQAFDARGRPDTTFGTNGSSTLAIESTPEGIALGGDGRAFAWGRTSTPQGTTWWIALLATTAGPAAQPPLLRRSRYVPMVPARVLDTRSGLGAPAHELAPFEAVDLVVGGVAGVPTVADGLTAVVLDVTATEARNPGYVTVWPAGQPMPVVSDLNVMHAGDTVASLVVVPVGPGGDVNLLSQTGAHLVADVVGCFTAADHASAGRFEAAPLPYRVLDTSVGTGGRVEKPEAGAIVTVRLTGTGPVPRHGVSAVVMNLTGTEATGAGFVTAYPTGVSLPVASNLNLDSGGTRANLVIVPVNPDGDVSLFTQSGTHLVADVTGWFTDATAPDATQGLYVPIGPRRMLDTRVTGNTAGPGGVVSRRVGGSTVVPAGQASAVVANLTATNSRGDGFVTAMASGSALPDVSNLNLPGAGWTVSNLAVIGLGDDGVGIYTQKGGDLILDVTGWFVA